MQIAPASVNLVQGPVDPTVAYKITFSDRTMCRRFIQTWGQFPVYFADDAEVAPEVDAPGVESDPGNGSVLFLAPGGVDRTMEIARNLGLDVDVELAPMRPNVEVPAATIPPAGDVDPELLHAVVARRRALLEIDSLTERVNVIAAIIKQYPNARTHILVPDRETGRTLAQRLRERGAGAIYARSARSTDAPAFDVITSPAHLLPHLSDLIVLWDANRSLRTEECRLRLYHTTGHRVFGFVDRRWAQASAGRHRRLVESFVGPVLDTGGNVADAAVRRRLVTLPYRCRIRPRKGENGV